MKDCLLKEIEALECDAEIFGFYWERFDQLMEQIRNECVEIEDAFSLDDRAHLQEEIGDLIQAAVSLAIFCKMDPHVTLRQSIDKFKKRYEAVVKMAKADGFTDLRGQTSDVLNEYWKRAKEKC